MNHTPGFSRRQVLLTLGLGATACASAACAATHRQTPTGHQPTSPASTSTSHATAAAPLTGKIIVIDPGHNGANADHPSLINRPVDIITQTSTCDTAGTETDSGYSEHAFNWDVAGRLKMLLQAQGARVVLTRADDRGVGPCINQRAAIGNRAGAHAAISIHADGAPADGHGFHIITPAPIPGHNTAIVPASAKLGLALRDAYHQATGVPYSTYAGTDGIHVRDDLGGLNFSQVPKVFIECGNMPNAGDAHLLTDPGFRQRIAQGLATGFTMYLTQAA